MCLMCDDETGEEKLNKAHRLALWAKKHPEFHGRNEIAKNYLLGVWSKEFLLAHPQIAQNHADYTIPDLDKFLTECDELIALHGTGVKAWNAMNKEISERILKWSEKHDNIKPMPDEPHLPVIPSKDAFDIFQEEKEKRLMAKFGVH